MILVHEAVQAIRNFNPPSPKVCVQIVIDLAGKVIAAVEKFFVTVFRFIFCVRNEDPKPIADNVEFVRWNNRIVDRELEALARGERNDVPVDMEALKAALRNGFGHPPISSQMTAEQFNELCRDYPDQKNKIGEWAAEWAGKQTVQLDPTHPFAEMFTTLKTFRAEFSRPGDREDFTLGSSHSHNQSISHYRHVYELLLSFQELTRPNMVELMRNLDNKSTGYNNPAYHLAQNKAKIIIYPLAGDLPDKLFRGIGCPGDLFTQVKALLPEHPNLMKEFMGPGGAFDSDNICFDAKVTTMETFRGRLTFCLDFSVVLPKYPTDWDRCFAYFQLFQNKQILRFVADRASDLTVINNETITPLHTKHKVAYDLFKTRFLAWRDQEVGEKGADIHKFMTEYLTKNRFKEELAEERLLLSDERVDTNLANYFEV